jgi:hypothetical protein
VIDKDVVEREEGNELSLTGIGIDVQAHERVNRFFGETADEFDVRAQRNDRV